MNDQAKAIQDSILEGMLESICDRIDVRSTCDRCGNPCVDGHEIRYYGPVDSETGYQDQELVCVECLERGN